MSQIERETSAARQAQQLWSQQPVQERLRYIRRLRQLLVEQRQRLWEAVQADVGRSQTEVLASELLPAASACRFLERRATRLLAPRRVPLRDRPLWLWGCHDRIYRRPWGVVAIIGTWNYPLLLNLVPIAQALTAGNAVLWKPSEQAPRSAAVLARLFDSAGFPPDLLQVLPATREAGQQLAEADIDFALFTGSETVGRILARRLGERLIPSALELSGCDPLWVLPDADLSLAARAAWFGTTFNRGQTCIAVRRIFVHRSVADPFRSELQRILMTATTLPSYRLQLLEQEQHYWRLLEDGRRHGAEILTIPKSESSAGCPPVFLWNVHPDAAALHESCFAPLAVVVLFDTLEQALALTRRCRFGLAASLFTRNTRQAEHWSALIPAGHVSINDALVPTAHPATPFGGRGASGWGVTQGADGLLALTTPQVVSIRRGRFRPHHDEAVQPHPATADLLEGLLRYAYGGSWRDLWQGCLQLLRGLRRR